MGRPKKDTYSEDKPPFSYVALCVMAIQSSPVKMMTLNQIYNFITKNFQFYRQNNMKWQNSLRHSLSYNDCFVKVSNYSILGRKSCYWTLHENCFMMFKDGSLRRRKQRFESKQMELKMERELSDVRKNYTQFTIENILRETNNFPKRQLLCC